MKTAMWFSGLICFSIMAFSGVAAGAENAAPAGGDAARALMVTGTVVETMSGGGYTYLLLSDGTQKVWAASPPCSVKTGEVVVVPPGMVMTDFYSKGLKRKFDKIFFVEGIQKANAEDAKAGMARPFPSGSGGMPPGHGMHKSPAPVLSFSNIARAAGGRTVAELYAEKAQWAGRTVAVRGRVAKFSPAIMDRNWIHIQDGTGKDATADLTITTTNMVKVGDLIVADGLVATNKIFGHGYAYEILMENAKISVETP